MKIIKGVLTFNSDEEFIDYTYNKKYKINYYVFGKIKLAFNLNIGQIVLFKIILGSTSMVIKLKECEWVSPLEKCLIEFERSEDYEMCSECIKLINDIKEKLLV